MKPSALSVCFIILIQILLTTTRLLAQEIKLGDFDLLDPMLLTTTNGIAEDTCGRIWLLNYKNQFSSFSNQPGNISLSRIDGYSTTKYNLKSGADLALETTSLTRMPNGAFVIPAHSFSEKKVFCILFNPHSFEEKIIELKPEDSKPDFISTPEYFENRIYLVARTSDSLHLFTFDIQFNQLSRKFLIKCNISNLNQGRLIPFSDHFIYNETRAGIIAFDWNGKLIRKFDNDYFGVSHPDSIGLVSISHLALLGDKLEVQLTPVNIGLPTFQYDTTGREFISTGQSPERLINQSPDQQVLKVALLPDRSRMAVLYKHANAGTIEIIDTAGVRNRLTIKEAKIINRLHLLQTQDAFCYVSNEGILLKSWIKLNIQSILPETSIRSIAPLKNNNVLIGTEDEGIYLFNSENLRLNRFNLYVNGDIFIPDMIRNIMVTDSTLWTNYIGGIVQVDLETGEATKYRHYPVECMVNGPQHIYYGTFDYAIMSFDKATGKNTILTQTPDLWHLDICFNHDTSGLVIGTNKGLQLYDFATKKLEINKFEDPLSSNFIMCLKRNSDSTILLGTNDGQIKQFNEASKTFTTIYEDPLKAPVATIAVVNDTTYWFNTFKGIIQWNAAGKNVIDRLTTFDGLSDDECNRYSQHRIDSTQWLIGTLNGLNLINTGTEPEPSESVSTVLKSLIRFDKNRDTLVTYRSDIELGNIGETIEIAAINRFLLMEFGLNNLLHQNNFRIEYMLDQSGWNPINQNGSVQFSDFSSGTHKLSIRVVNSIGEKTGEVKSYEIVVHPFFYQKWYFIVSVAALFLFLIYYFISQMRKDQKMQAEFSRKLLEVRDKELENISREIHDSAGQNLILLKQRAQQKKEYDLVELAGSALEELRAISHRIHPFILEKFGLTVALSRMLRMVDERSEIFLTTELENINGLLSKEMELHVYRLVQESITNILKHSNAASAVVQIKKRDNQIQIMIKDNGRGFDVRERMRDDSHLGLRTIRERVDILKGSIQIDSKLKIGTSIHIYVPIQHIRPATN